MVILLIAFAISFALVVSMLPRVLILSLRKRLVDPIDFRKVHNVPASRLGGVTFFPAILFSSWFCISIVTLFGHYVGVGDMFVIDVEVILEMLALLLLFMIGVYDDVIGVSYRKKFLIQIASAILIVLSGTYINTLHGLFGLELIPGYVGVPVTILLYVSVINALNLIDGIDGLASLISIMALLVYGILLWGNSMMEDGVVAFAAMGALVPFCYSNVFGIKRNAGSKIFMGDTGSLVIGAILGFTAVTIWNVSLDCLSKEPIHPLNYIFAYTMLIVPLFDVARIVIHRYLAKTPLFRPDRNHIHHKIMALGFTPRAALGYIITINFSFLILNALLSYVINFTYIVIINIVIWTVMHIYITNKIKVKYK